VVADVGHLDADLLAYLADDGVQRLELYLLPHSVADEHGNPTIESGCNGRRRSRRLGLRLLDPHVELSVILCILGCGHTVLRFKVR